MIGRGDENNRRVTWLRGWVVLAMAWMSVGSMARSQDQVAWPEIERRLPPVGLELSDEVERPLRARLDALDRQMSLIGDHSAADDVHVLTKSARWALDWRELYRDSDVDKLKQVLTLAEDRADAIAAGDPTWTTATGRVVRGYRSSIDGSVQPYGLEIPADYTADRAWPLYVWLHGRGDQATDLHFVDERLRRGGSIRVDDAIVVHPFGRHCIGFKHAGEIDVLEVVQEVQRQYSIDPRRIVLMGFSMGGAGCWHIGAHYPDRWVAMSPGAGFAETAQYIRLAPENYPPHYEQTLWNVYDVPSYTRNLFNLPVVAYSGEIDRQIQAAQVMEAAFRAEGRELEHLIGPATAHAYETETLGRLLERIATERAEGNDPLPDQVELQTRTLRYSQVDWIQVTGLEQHWQDSRVSASRTDEALELTTSGVLELVITDPRSTQTLTIDGQTLAEVPTDRPLVLSRVDDSWRWGPLPEGPLRKRPRLQGPIDDAFMAPFLVVKPSRPAAHPLVQRWLDAELAHFEQRWATLFRGELRVKFDHEMTAEDEANYHLIVWGDAAANQYLERLLPELPLNWTEEELELCGHTVSSDHHLPILIQPNPRSPGHYVVLNSGPTFREAHDRTNSLQNPKLPDWALLDLSEPPTDESAGRVLDAGFFDEQWR